MSKGGKYIAIKNGDTDKLHIYFAGDMLDQDIESII